MKQHNNSEVAVVNGVTKGTSTHYAQLGEVRWQNKNEIRGESFESSYHLIDGMHLRELSILYACPVD